MTGRFRSPGETYLPHCTEGRQGGSMVKFLRPQLWITNPHYKGKWMLLDSGHPTYHQRNYGLT